MTSILRSIGFKKPKHQKLSEEWTDCPEPVKEGMTFYCKYVGSTPIEQSSNVTMTSHAVKHIMSMAKAKGKKLPNIALRITPNYITGTLMTDGNGNTVGSASAAAAAAAAPVGDKKEKEKSDKKKSSKKSASSQNGEPILAADAVAANKKVDLKFDADEWPKQSNSEKSSSSNTVLQSDKLQLFNISIYRIPYCFAENSYDRIVSFVSTTPNGAHECHAIMTDKRKNAHAIALTISSAFDIAFERMNKNKKSKEEIAAALATKSSRLSLSAISSVSSSTDTSTGSSEKFHDSAVVENGGKPAATTQYPVLTLTRNLSFNRRHRRTSDKENNPGAGGDEVMEVDHSNHKIGNEPKLLIDLDGTDDFPMATIPSGKMLDGKSGGGKNDHELTLDELRDLF